MNKSRAKDIFMIKSTKCINDAFSSLIIIYRSDHLAFFRRTLGTKLDFRVLFQACDGRRRGDPNV